MRKLTTGIIAGVCCITATMAEETSATTVNTKPQVTVTKNDDGSVTRTVEAANGTVTKTATSTVANNPDGSRTVTTDYSRTGANGKTVSGERTAVGKNSKMREKAARPARQAKKGK